MIADGGSTDSAVNLAPIANADDEDADEFVFDAGNNAVVADAIHPEFAEFAALQCLTEAARIFKGSDAVEEEAGNSAGNLLIELSQLALCFGA